VEVPLSHETDRSREVRCPPVVARDDTPSGVPEAALRAGRRSPQAALQGYVADRFIRQNERALVLVPKS
jgi:hypothetical protein